MIRCVCLGVLLAALAVAASADPAPKAPKYEVTWSATFKDGELEDYFKRGDITWNKRRGGFVVGPNSLLVREALVVCHRRIDL